MIKNPSNKQGVSDDDASFEAMKKLNQMIKSLTNKLQVKVGPWNLMTSLKLNAHQAKFTHVSLMMSILWKLMYSTTVGLLKQVKQVKLVISGYSYSMVIIPRSQKVNQLRRNLKNQRKDF